MTIGERMDHFDHLFARLKRNRELLSLEELKTVYAEAYGELVSELTADADWWAISFIQTMCSHFPLHPKDEEGNRWLQQKVDQILREERAPGGLVEQYRKTLVEDLDRPGFEVFVCAWYNRFLKEAYEPFYQRYNRWVGKPGNRWIYNDALQKFWLPPRVDRKNCTTSGRWVSTDLSGLETRFPPNIGPDPEAVRTA